jgi:hypothetical protein
MNLTYMKKLFIVFLLGTSLVRANSQPHSGPYPQPGGGSSGGAATNAISSISGPNILTTYTTNSGAVSATVSLTNTLPNAVAGTNQNIGEVWGNDFGFTPTNSALGNSNALNQMILVCSNMGGGIIHFGGLGNTNTGGSGPQTISFNGEHYFPKLLLPSRIKLKGDGATVLKFTGASTTIASLYGSFDVEDVVLSGPFTSGTYPYTNLVGIVDGMLFDPQFKNVQVAGFGQNIALIQTGSYRGASLIGVHGSGPCGIGLALGDFCDGTQLLGTDFRQCTSVALDEGCIIPLVTNAIPAMTGQQNSTNVGVTRFVTVDGGIWDYSDTVFVCGKGYMQILNAYIGTPTNYCLTFGHDTRATAIIPYQNENNAGLVSIRAPWWSENVIKTNIFVTPSAQTGAFLSIEGPGTIGGTSGYGIIGTINYLSWEPNVFAMGQGTGTNLWQGTPVATIFKDVGGEFLTAANAPISRYWSEVGGNFGASQLVERDDFNSATADVFVPWSVGFVDGSRIDRARMGLNSLGGNTYALELNNINLEFPASGGVSIGTNGPPFTGELLDVWGMARILSNAAPYGVVSNVNITAPASFTNPFPFCVELRGPVELQAATSTAVTGALPEASVNITNNINGIAVNEPYQYVASLSPSTNNTIQYYSKQLGPGDYISLVNGVVTGNQSSVTFPTQWHMTITR